MARTNCVYGFLCLFFVAMVQRALSCHVMPEKLINRKNMCQGPSLLLPDVGSCGTFFPQYLEDLSFKVFFPWAELTKTYVLIMVDPDAPMKEYPLLADYVHWLLADIPGHDLLSGVVSALEAKELIPYKQPTPPPGSGYHRYQLFLFESPEDMTANDIVGYSASSRARFNLSEFVIANNMCFNLRATFEMNHEEGKYAMNRLIKFKR